MSRASTRSSWVLVICLIGAVSGAASTVPEGPDAQILSFEERVSCQAKVEDVYWSYRIWPDGNPGPKPNRVEVMPRKQVADKVERGLFFEAVLENVLNQPLTAGMIQAELDRLGRETRQPELLLDVFSALDHDPKLVVDCFVRPLLAERLVREEFAWDRDIHREVRLRAEVELGGARSVADLEESRARLEEVRWIRQEEPDVEITPGPSNGNEVHLAPDQWEQLMISIAGRFMDENSGSRAALTQRSATEVLAQQIGRGPSPLFEEADGFSAVQVVEVDDGSLRIASATWPKVDVDDWLASLSKDLRRVTPTTGVFTLPEIEKRNGCDDDSWVATSMTGAPAGRYYHSSVWTGTEMIVWGGFNGSYLNTGGRYEPVSDSWTATSTAAAPAGRAFHTAVWTGTEMIIWGGKEFNTFYVPGGRYNPATDTWTATTTTGAPSGRYRQTGVWTGTELIVWGGFYGGYLNTGGRYDPVLDSWAATTTTDAPSGRQWPKAIWTGAEMIVCGGHPYTPTGGRYDPTTDSWMATSTTDAPSGRAYHTLIWTGTEMIVWGGNDGTYLNTGGRYDPVSDTWTATSMTAVPAARANHSAVWTGLEMIVWGGTWPNMATGGRYNPAADSWNPTSTSGAPSARYNQTAEWSETTTEMIVWGGYSGPYLDTGGRYCALDPEFDFGDAPDPTFPTLLASNGARHRIGGALFLGSSIDIDADGQPSSDATGDDLDPEGDDEDGVVFTSLLVPGGSANVDVEASAAGLLNAWIDFNADGDWDDADEQIFTDEPLAAGVNPLVFSVPGGASQGDDTFARFRVDTAGGLSFAGAADDGEVEDYQVSVEELDFGDAPDPTYPTLMASNGARHVLGSTLFMGVSVDADDDGQPTPSADGDDGDGSDDEDGVIFTSMLVPGEPAGLDVQVSQSCLLNAWIDFNADGDWSDAGEHVFADEALAAGVNSLVVAVPAAASPGSTSFARFRVDSGGGLAVTGEAADGEVEDHLLYIEELDFGDAPDPTYPTLLVSDGARHILGYGLFLGATVDADAGGQPTPGADGDDNDGSDDEDGVVFTSGIGVGLNASVDVTASGSGLLNAWVDFNADGDWNDAGEQVFTDNPVVAGVNPLSFAVPAGATLGTTCARFRLDSSGGLAPDGLALDGEVEDEQVEIMIGADLEVTMSSAPDPVASGRELSYTVTVANNGPLDATSVVLTDTLPAEVIFVSSTPGTPNCVFGTGVLTCDLGALAPSASAEVTIDVVLDHPVWGSLSNVATATATENDPIPANDTATAITVIGLFFDDFESGTTSAWSSTS